MLGTNIAANSIPLGSDLAMLLPRYMNMVRGQCLGLLLAWAICPWKIYASAAVFTKFLSGYGLFMGGLTGIIVTDYLFITKGNLFMENLFDGKRTNPTYYYLMGWNVQAYIAYIAGCAIGFPGFCGNLGADVSNTAKELGYLGWILAFTVSALVYYLLCSVWPTQSQLVVKNFGLLFEQKALGEDFVFSSCERIDIGYTMPQTSDPEGKEKDKTAVESRGAEVGV